MPLPISRKKTLAERIRKSKVPKTEYALDLRMVPMDPVLVCALLAAIQSTPTAPARPPRPTAQTIAAKAAFDAAGWSCNAAAKVLGTSRQAVWRVLTGSSKNPELLERIMALPPRSS